MPEDISNSPKLSFTANHLKSWQLQANPRLLAHPHQSVRRWHDHVMEISAWQFVSYNLWHKFPGTTIFTIVNVATITSFKLYPIPSWCWAGLEQSKLNKHKSTIQAFFHADNTDHWIDSVLTAINYYDSHSVKIKSSDYNFILNLTMRYFQHTLNMLSKHLGAEE